MIDLKYLDLYKNVTNKEMIEKLNEEVKEVEFELVVPNTNRKDLAGELLDVMQVCMGIAYINGIDLEKYVISHNEKMLSRGHKFM